MPEAVPNATYRLQFSKDFGFAAAADLIPYLKALGISHIYASPFLRARKGSSHGYDVVDHNQIDPQFGGGAGFARLSAALAEADMGIILDFVPNHMGIGHADNMWWLDVLEWGPASPYARFFDIDWRNVPGRSGPAVTLPMLGKPYGEVLEAGELQLSFDAAEGSFSIWYFEHRLPVRPSDYAKILRAALAQDAQAEAARPILGLVEGLRLDRAGAADLKAALAARKDLHAPMETGLRAFSPETASGIFRLHKLLLRQHYTPAYWRRSASEINYRRFFDINDLAGLRMEDGKVFAATHRLVRDLIRTNRLHGLRLDHIDGLYDPAGYCRQLGELVNEAGGQAGRFYILIEKILGEGEALPEFPNVAGTTGYEWLNVIARTFVDDRALPALEDIWRSITDERRSYDEMEKAAKAQVISTMFAGELATLVRLLRRIAAGHRRSQDFTAEQLGAALQAYVAALPVYRTYVTPASGASKQDRAVVNAAISAARTAAPRADPALFDFLADLITLDILRKEHGGYSRRRVADWLGKLQQFTGPVMAKALEDTCFYRHFRLIALNEVGGHPDARGIDAAIFHALMLQRISQQPYGLTATATHDTKRGEDARMRLVALTELSEDWGQAVQQWRELNAGSATGIEPSRAPSPGHEYLIYQALLGAWPLDGPNDAFAARAAAYAIKAAREGKQETSWHYPDAGYEMALERFIRRILDAGQAPDFIRSFSAIAERAALLGALNSLSQTALKLTMPGVPDIFQGTEFWDLSFVDPDNRRPVDFELRRQSQAALHGGIDWADLAAAWPDGRIKFTLLQRLLQLRAMHAALFRHGDYQAVIADGDHAKSVIAFSRGNGADCVVIGVGRLMGTLSQGGLHWPKGADWGKTSLRLPKGKVFRNGLTADGREYRDELPLSSGFADFPVVILIAIP